MERQNHKKQMKIYQVGLKTDRWMTFLIIIDDNNNSTSQAKLFTLSYLIPANLILIIAL